MSGRISKRTYAIRCGAENWVFVPHPLIATWWFRAHPSVIVVDCQHCGSVRGEPCKGKNGYVGFTHYMRRRDGRHSSDKLSYATAIVAFIESPNKKVIIKKTMTKHTTTTVET